MSGTGPVAGSALPPWRLIYGRLRHANAVLACLRNGIETTPNEIRKVSFDHLAEADMERELKLAEQAFAREPAFRGFVIHHFSGYQRWLARKK